MDKDAGVIIRVLCIGGELTPADLQRIVTVRGSVQTMAVSWNDAPDTLNQFSFGFVVMDTFDASLDRQRDQILGMLPASTVVLMIPRFEAGKAQEAAEERLSGFEDSQGSPLRTARRVSGNVTQEMPGCV